MSVSSLNQCANLHRLICVKLIAPLLALRQEDLSQNQSIVLIPFCTPKVLRGLCYFRNQKKKKKRAEYDFHHFCHFPLFLMLQ